MSSNKRIQIMFGVDLPRYSGRWYEIARSPFNYESFLVSSSSDQEPSFSVECEAATADYETVETPDGLGLRIINRCLNSQGQEISRATGVASPISDRSLGALLRVKFDSFMATTPNGKSILLPTSADLGERLEGYWIHWLADDYSLAIVGSPETVNVDKYPFLRGQVWVLSRTPRVSRNTMQMLVDRIRAIGYDPETVLANPNVIS